MLVLERRIDEDILIGDDIFVRVVKICGGCVKLGIEAPKHINIDRREVRMSKEIGTINGNKRNSNNGKV